MGFKIIENDNYLEINEKKFNFNELLLNFIYKDYSCIFDYVNLSAKKFKIFLDKDLSDITTYNNVRTFFEQIYLNNPYKENEEFKNDPFFILFLYEFYKVEDSLTYENSLQTIIDKITCIISNFRNLQDLYYEAINLCFNKSHKILSIYSIEERIDYYSNLPYGINAILHLPQNSTFSSQFVCIQNKSELNDNLFNSEENFIYKEIQSLSPSTYVESRQNSTTYNKREKEIAYSHEPIYTIPNNKVLEDLKHNLYNKKYLVHVLDFNNVLSLCSFLFFKMIENRNSFSIQECKLCRKLFSKSYKSIKKYCNNIFSDTNQMCSDINIGPKITLEIKNMKNSFNDFYNRLNKRYDKRPYRKDRNALKDLHTIRKSYINGNISPTKFEEYLNFFDTISPNSYARDSLPDSLKEILEKITST